MTWEQRLMQVDSHVIQQQTNFWPNLQFHSLEATRSKQLITMSGKDNLRYDGM